MSPRLHRPVIGPGAGWFTLATMAPRILIVDDERDFTELVQFRLAGLGCEFLVAYDGVHALSQARQFKPSLILLDILLPDLDGLSVCEILRRQPATKKIPVIFMSALSAGVTKRTAVMQADDFFTKPLDLPRLQQRILQLLQRRPDAG
ncbi:MAG: response regulator [Verrucomicrobiota bacterium]|nr:response regulator [Verrucomicrobiota bacterium]